MNELEEALANPDNEVLDNYLASTATEDVRLHIEQLVAKRVPADAADALIRFKQQAKEAIDNLK